MTRTPSVAVTLAPLTRENWRDCARLELAPGQERLVASNMASIAESKFEPHYVPRAIYADGQMAGFLMYCPDVETDEDGVFWIFRLMTDHRLQRKGIGSRAIELALAEIAEQGGRTVRISHVPDNVVAAALYRRLGFVPTGEVEEGEVVLAMELEEGSR